MTHSPLLLITLLSLLATSAFCARAPSPFVLVTNGLVTASSTSACSSNNNKAAAGIPFTRSWLYDDVAEKIDRLNTDHLPQYLGVPDYVRVYEHVQTGIACLLSDLARAAWRIVDRELSQHGAILFRNLNIGMVQDFKKFWKACCEDGGWTPTKYVPFGPNRARLQDVDLATNIPAPNALPPHNEMAYNPRPPSRIAFYCLQHARVGGETLVVKNEQLTDSIRDETLKLVKQEGLLYMRHYRDESHNATTMAWPSQTWQEKCKTHDREEAIRFFAGIGFNRDDIIFDEMEQ